MLETIVNSWPLIWVLIALVFLCHVEYKNVLRHMRKGESFLRAFFHYKRLQIISVEKVPLNDAIDNTEFFNIMNSSNEKIVPEVGEEEIARGFALLSNVAQSTENFNTIAKIVKDSVIKEIELLLIQLQESSNKRGVVVLESLLGNVKEHSLVSIREFGESSDIALRVLEASESDQKKVRDGYLTLIDWFIQSAELSKNHAGKEVLLKLRDNLVREWYSSVNSVTSMRGKSWND